MSNTITMGSLFSGIGGFEAAASWYGVKCVWQSEIEPWAVELLKTRFPDARQLGDVCDINGAEIPPVDIVTFGSPCQNMSIAGAREGLDGSQSRLFYEAIRIIREMRENTNGKYPSFAVWENVPGAFTSNKGMDFRTVLEEITETEIPMPKSGRWANSGVVRGGTADVAWRVMDAQYWGALQRRKRIYLVADFRGQRAGEILFKPESVPGYTSPRGKAWESIAADIGADIDKTGEGSNADVTDYKGALCVCIPQVYDARGNGDGKVSPTITGDHNNRITDYTAILCEPIVFQGQSSASAGLSISNEVSPTIQCTKNVDVAMPIYALDRAAYNQGINAQYDIGIDDSGIVHTVVAKGPGAVCAPTKNLYYIVRRLTPSECAKLQGFPEGWHKGIINAKGKEMPDTAAYKGYGNAVATVCAEYPIQGIVEALREEKQ